MASLGIDKAGGLKELKIGTNPDGSTDRSMILIYETQDQAQKAINQIHGKKFDANNTF